MRLRQLARKLGVQPDKIVTFLAENGHELENEANSKLTQEQEDWVEAHFVPEPEEQYMADTAEPEAIETPHSTSSEASVATEAAPEEAEASASEPIIDTPETQESTATTHEVPFGPPAHATSQVSDSEQETAPISLPKKIDLEPEVEVNVYRAYEEDESYADAELIRQETPQLEGLKVLGKIELPEPKKPKEEAEDENAKEEAGDERKSNRNQRGRGRKGRQSKQRLNPVEYERRKAEKEAKRKKAEAAKKLKQKKKEHYLANVKPKAPSAKPKNETVREEEEMAPLPIVGMSRPKPEPEAPKGPKPKRGLKKLWAWLNGEYDKF